MYNSILKHLKLNFYSAKMNEYVVEIYLKKINLLKKDCHKTNLSLNLNMFIFQSWNNICTNSQPYSYSVNYSLLVSKKKVSVFTE